MWSCVSTTAAMRFGLFIELVTDGPSTRAFFDLSERVAAGWDGAEPFLRPLEAAA